MISASLPLSLTTSHVSNRSSHRIIYTNTIATQPQPKLASYRLHLTLFTSLQRRPVPAPSHHTPTIKSSTIASYKTKRLPHPSIMAAQLRPLPSPIAIFPEFIARQSENIKLREKMMSLSGDSFYVELYPSAQPLLTVKGEAFSLSGRKTVSDMQGNPLFVIRKEHFKLMSTYYAESPQGGKIFEVQGKWSWGSSKSVGVFQYKDQQTGQVKEGRLFMKGDFFDRRAEITDESTGQPVAVIDRQFLNARELLGGQQTYIVTVAPGMDMAIVVAMCICLDERRNEGS